MSNRYVKYSFMDFKQDASELAKERNLKKTHSHEILARKLGFNTYNSMFEFLDVNQAILDYEDFKYDKRNTK